MKLFIAIILTLFSLSAFSAIEPCGEGQNESPEYNWVKAANITVVVIIEEIDALLCIGMNKKNSTKIEYVSYRDSWGLDRVYSFQDLTKGTVVLLKDTDINLGVVRKGKIMSMKLTQLKQKDNLLQFKIALRFLRNLAKMPTKRDHRELQVNMIQNSDGSLRAFYQTEDEDFNNLVIRIGPSLSINELDLKDFEIYRARIQTKELPKIPNL